MKLRSPRQGHPACRRQIRRLPRVMRTSRKQRRRAELERRALADNADRLVSTDKVGAAVAAYAANINRENRERRVQADSDTRSRGSNARSRASWRTGYISRS